MDEAHIVLLRTEHEKKKKKKTAGKDCSMRKPLNKHKKKKIKSI